MWLKLIWSHCIQQSSQQVIMTEQGGCRSLYVSFRHQGPVAQRMVSANHWLRGNKT